MNDRVLTADRHSISKQRHARGHPPSHRRAVLMLMCFLAASAAVSYRVITHFDPTGRPNDAAWALVDFRDAIYYPTQAFLRGENPYDAYTHVRRYPVASTFPLYSPLTFMVHLPFALLPLSLASLLYYATVLGLILLTATLVVRLVGLRATAAAVLGVAALIVISRPGQSTLFLGQYAAAMTVAIYAALYFAERRPWLAGAALALTTVKPSFAVPCMALLLSRGVVRPVLFGGIIAAAATALPLALVIDRAGGIAPFVQTLAESHRLFAGVTVNRADMSATRIDAAPLVTRLIGASSWSHVEGATSVALIAIGGGALYRLRRCRRRDGNGLIAAVLCLTVLTSVYHQPYDALLLALPLAWLAHDVAVYRAARRPLRFVLIGLMTIPAVNYVGSFSLLEALALAEPLRTLIISVNSAALTVALLVSATFAFLHPVPSTTLRAPRWWRGAPVDSPFPAHRHPSK